jgi:sporulation protein YlmC with PRC-barrel domain
MKSTLTPLARSSLLALIIGLGPVAVSAQTGGYRDREQNSQTPAGTQSGSTNNSSNVNSPGTGALQSQSDSTLSRHAGKPGKRLGDFKGRDLYNRQGDKLGTIDDVVIDIRSGEASHVIVNHGGMLGMGQRSRAVPMSGLDYQVTANEDEKRLVLDITSARWAQAPAFDRNRLSDLGAGDQQARLDSFYGTTSRYRATGGAASSGHDRDANRNPQTGATTNTTHNTTPGMNPADRGQTGSPPQAGSVDANRVQPDIADRDQNRIGANGGANTAAGSRDASSSSVGMNDSDSRNQNRQLALASEIKGKTLRSGTRDVGSIEDIVIRVDQQKAFALIDPSNDMVEGDEKFLVPFNRIDRAGDDRFTTTLSRQDFDQARTGTAGISSRGDVHDGIERWSDDNRVHGTDQRY